MQVELTKVKTTANWTKFERKADDVLATVYVPLESELSKRTTLTVTLG